jgi:hypothetical protein
MTKPRKTDDLDLMIERVRGAAVSNRAIVVRRGSVR